MKPFQTFKLARPVLFLLMLLVCSCAVHAQDRTVQQASDSDVASGADVKRYINPAQLQKYGGGGGPTNGQTAAQVAIQINTSNTTVFANTYLTPTGNGAALSGVIAQKFGAGTSNSLAYPVTTGELYIGSTDRGIYKNTAGFPGITIDPGSGNFIKTLGSIMAGGALQMGGFGISGAGAVSGTSFSGDGSALSNLNGANMQNGTLPVTATDTSWPPRSNYPHVAGTATAGYMIASTGTNDSYGSPVYTNGPAPAGGGALAGNGWAVTNLNTWDAPTNDFSGTTFWLGTNMCIVTGSGVGFTAIGNAPPQGIERYGQLTIVATASIAVTNPPAWQANDHLLSRTLTNGNSATIALDMQIGKYTNFFFIQCGAH